MGQCLTKTSVCLTWTPFQPPQLVASALFNSCLVPFSHSGPLLPGCHLASHPPFFLLPSPLFLPLNPVASAPANLRRWAVPNVPAVYTGQWLVPCASRGSITIVVPYIAGLCRPPPPLNRSSTRELQIPNCTGSQLISAGFTCMLLPKPSSLCFPGFVLLKRKWL